MNILTSAQRNSKVDFDWSNRSSGADLNPHKDLRSVMLTKAIRDNIAEDKEFQESFFLRAKVLPVTSHAGLMEKKGYRAKLEFARFDDHYHPTIPNWVDYLTVHDLKEDDSLAWTTNRLRPTYDLYGGAISKKGMISSVKRGCDSNIREASEASYLLFLYNTLIKDQDFGEKVDKKMMKMNPYCFPGMGEGWRRAGSFTKDKKYLIVNGDWPDHEEGEYPSLKTVYLYARGAAYRRLKQWGWERAGSKPGEYIWRANWREVKYFAENPSVILNHIPIELVMEARRDWENWGKRPDSAPMRDRPRTTELHSHLINPDNIQALLRKAFENPNHRRDYV